MFIEIEEKPAILVVDSDPGLCDRLDAMLNGGPHPRQRGDNDSLSYLIHGCANSTEAVATLENRLARQSCYQLAFVNIRLADGDGLTLIRELWALDSDLHAVLYYGDDLSWQAVVDTLGESDQLLILQQPFSDLELRQAVHAMMRKSQLGKQSRHVMQFMEQQINRRSREIEDANKTLLQSEKLAAVGQLAAGIAHEINTPAQYVADNIKAISDFFHGMTRLLAFYRQLLTDQGQQELLARIAEQEQKEDLAFILDDAPQALEQSLEGVAQIVRIVQAMKGFSHAGQGRVAKININLALENTLLVAHNSYKYVADVETRFSDLPAIECYPGELNQVFLNIIVNAAHAIEDHKRGRGKITIITEPSATGVEIRIADTGHGIPIEIRDKVFDPFFTTKDVGRGSGQGLNISYRIIHQLHGGSLSFDSEVGVGTTFVIRLNHRLPAQSKQ